MKNLSNSDKIQVVINTLKSLEMPPTYDNSSRMVGIYKMLVEVRDEIHAQEEAAKQAEEPVEVEEDAGEADTE